MAIYIMFIRPDGLQGTWAFFNLVFLQKFQLFVLEFIQLK